ncbi:uncharacterized protein LOC130416957 isoform X1 [Triplophysa dalaica]|uniref:uncharacterized protein LOC130416957 isoform X1 n=1 Tax=Triplophysa dalaica TaxID=1582913 RepID=UPI0024DF4372|nr:uncharacterized protein LOC130416957 isoform X1 [Triplophysa dalaica]
MGQLAEDQPGLRTGTNCTLRRGVQLVRAVPGDEEGIGGRGRGQASFFYISTNPCKNLNSHFQAAWKEMGLPKYPTFTDLQSGIATHARNNGTVEDRSKLSRFMCHDTRTADKFYACNLNTKEAWEHRQLFEKVPERGLTCRTSPSARPARGLASESEVTMRLRSPHRPQLRMKRSWEVYQELGVSSVDSEEIGLSPVTVMSPAYC